MVKKLFLDYSKPLLLLVFIFNLIFYVFQVNSLVENSYYLTDYQKTIRNLNQEIASLEIKTSLALSLDKIENKARELGFQKIDKVKFIKAYGTFVKRNLSE